MYKVYVPRRLFFKEYFFNSQLSAYKAVGLLRKFQAKHKNFRPFDIHVQGPFPYTNTEIFQANAGVN